MHPVALAQPLEGSDRLFVVLQEGRVMGFLQRVRHCHACILELELSALDDVVVTAHPHRVGVDGAERTDGSTHSHADRLRPGVNSLT